MGMFANIHSFLLIFCCASTCHAFIENLYCGNENCYEVLDVEYEATKSEITKAYRSLARKWHPDMHKSKADKEAAAIMFQKVANAYEILRDEEQRSDYNYYLDHPEEYYSHYYRYYSRRMAPKVDVRIVIAVTITVISVIQYWSAWNNYNSAVSYLITVPKYRMQAVDIAKSEGLYEQISRMKKDKTKTKVEIKEEQKEAEEIMLKKILQDKMDIRGGYRKPNIYDILWLRLVFLPYTVTMYIYWWVRWIWKFWLLKQDYGPEEQQYIIRRNMKMSQGQWEALEDQEKEKFLGQQLWITSKFKEWKRLKEEEMKAELATNSRYKSYRRYMKKGGPGQMSFGPE